jgi:hypothetical protein
MSFMHRGGWYCQFLEEDLKTPLPRKLTLQDPAKLIEMAEHGGYSLRSRTSTCSRPRRFEGSLSSIQTG